jgi:hypothetical protein
MHDFSREMWRTQKGTGNLEITFKKTSSKFKVCRQYVVLVVAHVLVIILHLALPSHCFSTLC